VLTLAAPYLVFVGRETSARSAKTGFGIVHWRRELCVGQVRLAPDAIDLGLPDMNVEEGAAAGASTLIIGTAQVGGVYDSNWTPTLLQGLKCGMDVAAGLHARLADQPELAEAAARLGRRLIDVRIPPEGLPVGSGRKRSGRRLLTVGTDVVSGKKYTALALYDEMRKRGMKADFRASGQTGILISGAGIPIDAVVCDFTSGAAEQLSPDNEPDHWDLVEGQGSLYHPGYAGVSLSLLHGTQPDAIVLCHEAGRQHVHRYPDYPIPDLADCIRYNLQAGRLTNPNIICVGVSLNTAALAPQERASYLRAAQKRLQLPCVDPLQGGVGPLVEALRSRFQ
jgi:uncharacterized NAD-dependent epimerase/dehydratase family protein